MISLRSEITRKLLNYFFINPQENLYVNELSRKLDLDKRNLVKKLKEKLYSINKDYPLYEEYKKIILKTIGVEDKLRRILTEIEGIKEAYIYGSYAQNKMDIHSDIDLLVIGDYKISLLQKNLSKLQREIDREINSVSMDELEFKKRVKKRDPFISEVLKNKHIQLI